MSKFPEGGHCSLLLQWPEQSPARGHRNCLLRVSGYVSSCLPHGFLARMLKHCDWSRYLTIAESPPRCSGHVAGSGRKEASEVGFEQGVQGNPVSYSHRKNEARREENQRTVGHQSVRIQGVSRSLCKTPHLFSSSLFMPKDCVREAPWPSVSSSEKNRIHSPQ